MRFKNLAFRRACILKSAGSVEFWEFVLRRKGEKARLCLSWGKIVDLLRYPPFLIRLSILHSYSSHSQTKFTPIPNLNILFILNKTIGEIEKSYPWLVADFGPYCWKYFPNCLGSEGIDRGVDLLRDRKNYTGNIFDFSFIAFPIFFPPESFSQTHFLPPFLLYAIFYLIQVREELIYSPVIYLCYL